MFVLVNAIIGVAQAGIGKLTHMQQTGTFGIGMSRNGLSVFGIGVFSSPIVFQAHALATFLPFLAVEVRRLHDIGRAGWWWLFGLIPIRGHLAGPGRHDDASRGTAGGPRRRNAHRSPDGTMRLWVDGQHRPPRADNGEGKWDRRRGPVGRSRALPGLTA